MFGTLKKYIATAVIAATSLFTTSDLDAQNRRVPRNNRTITIRVGPPRLQVHRPLLRTRSIRCQPSRLRILERARHIHRRGCFARPRFRHTRHIERFYNSQRHARHRCTFCLDYDRWAMWRRCRLY